jgi:hypothetical protein
MSVVFASNLATRNTFNARTLFRRSAAAPGPCRSEVPSSKQEEIDRFVFQGCGAYPTQAAGDDRAPTEEGACEEDGVSVRRQRARCAPTEGQVCGPFKQDATIDAKQILREIKRSKAFVQDMDQEQPNFKVTDRRLFNADGSPRDLPEEEKPPAPPEVASTSPAEPEQTVVEAPADEEVDPAVPEEEEELNEAELADARDPASFVNFLMSIASNAASALGMMEHPVTHQRDVDLELGKHWIDVLGMLERKTRGNLSKQEKQMLEGLLGDLRMQYVSLQNATPKPKFSASDITGGR